MIKVEMIVNIRHILTVFLKGKYVVRSSQIQ